MQVLLLTVVKTILSNLYKKFIFSIQLNQRNVRLGLTSNHIGVLNKITFLKYITKYLMFRKLDQLFIFTKRFNINKLYIQCNTGFFLSSGILLRFLKQDSERFMKKRFKIWLTYIKALRMLQKRHYLILFKDFFGKKGAFLKKLRKTKVKIGWVFIKLNQRTFITKTRSKRRIKRWIKKNIIKFKLEKKYNVFNFFLWILFK